ncbi:uncharacterized protein LOC120681392 [Panicum virgatum]|uniref:uncharacterized protein LOC120681392 n=1 Tax=Panicum virgatum TaxID=38727 RepID=UPI0019D5A5BE|nr:uncharacterized protein LOC120681392 [Panicum virgatum]
MTSRQRKRERREVYSVTKATPSYLGWSENTIYFGRKDNPHYVPNPGQYPLIEVLTFEVVGFRGAYDAILGRPYYTKFMAISNYTYLKMKMPGPKGVVTVGSSFEHAYECDVECIEHAEALALDEDLTAQLQGMAEEAMGSKQQHAGNFESAEGTKDVPLDPKTPDGKALKISATLNSK